MIGLISGFCLNVAKKRKQLFQCVRTDCVISTFQNNYILLHIKDPNDTSNLQLLCIFSIFKILKNFCLDFFKNLKVWNAVLVGNLFQLKIFLFR
jgi:hypothetical protein